jgi:Ca2+-binding RTX toxin-like protein
MKIFCLRRARGSIGPRAGLVSMAVVALLSAAVVVLPAGGAHAVEDSCAGRSSTIIGSDDADVIYGTPDDDVISAGKGDDLVFALEGNDVICGGGGHDEIYAGPNEDLTLGGAGDDTLFGGAGYDTGDGGPGTNVCHTTEDPQNC